MLVPPKILFPLALLSALPTFAQDVEAFRQDLAAINAEIADVDAVTAKPDGGLILALADMRRQALLLSKAVLESRILGADTGTPTQVFIPVVQPDEQRAAEIVRDMAEAQQRISEAEKDASEAGGLMQAVALSRVETEKLSLAQLRMGYFQAKYGIAFPAPTPASADRPASVAPASGVSDASAAPDAPEWADPRFPGIDYSIPPLKAAHDRGERISGWWSIAADRAAVDDSPQVTSVNYSEYRPGAFSGATRLVARCTEGETAFIFLQDDFLLGDFQRHDLDVTYRIDDAPAHETRWSGLTSNKGVGLFGRDAEDFIRSIYDSERMFIRIRERNGEQHDALFDLAGAPDAFTAVAAACGWSTIKLTTDDYRAVQTLLKAGGFDVGTPDGQWGPGSKNAMKAFQRSVGLPESGAPDRASLEKLGLPDGG